MFTRRSIPKHIHSVLESGPFHPHYGGPPGGTAGARISFLHLLTNQEGNLCGVCRCGRRDPHMRDIIDPLGRNEAHTPPDPSDMSNLEFRVQINFSFMDGLLQVSSTHSVGGRWGATDIGPGERSSGQGWLLGGAPRRRSSGQGC